MRAGETRERVRNVTAWWITSASASSLVPPPPKIRNIHPVCVLEEGEKFVSWKEIRILLVHPTYLLEEPVNRLGE